ncbi:MAG: hypothetical protein CMJ50_08990 [Planctomycetaceae bacterium]|jgi:MoaA/NifB/PqqE/SkfB family radical SAM enzyme|nr:hypothetical protein [Planctomycetaceae bacterium]
METESGYNRFSRFKVLMHAENIDRFLQNGMSKPIIVDLELSNLCDHACIWCEPLEYRKGSMQMLAAETTTRAIHDIAAVGSKMVRFCGGGEPMTNPFLGQAMKIAHDRGLGVICNSNGSRILENSEYILNYCDYFRVSLDAIIPKTHDKLHCPRGQETFAKIIRGLRELVRGRNKRRGKTEIGAAFLIHPDNYQEIPAFARELLETGVDFVHFRPVCLRSEVEDQRLRAIMDAALKMVSRCRQQLETEDFKIFGITKKMEGVWFEREWKKCYSPFFLPVLGANGRIYACCDRRDFDLGDYQEHGFADVYHSTAFREKARAIDVRKCLRCTNRDLNEVIHFCFEQDSLKRDLL